MKMRKLVAALLAVLMLCSIIPFSAMAADSSAKIDFTDKANRTAYTTEQQVWEQNGITVTNDKGASTSNVGDYGGEGYPARFYKSSTVKIEYPGMTSIVIDCTGLEAKYVDGWSDSFSANATASVENGIVTIELAEAADSFTWEKMSAQSRAYSITVYTNGAAPEQPEVPEVPETPEVPDTPDTPDTPAGALGVVTNPVEGVAYKLGLDQTQKGAIYYFTGVMSGYYGATDTSVDNAVDMYVEIVDGGYMLYFEDANATRKYIALTQSGTHYNFTFGATGSVFTLDAERNALYATAGDQICYMGTYGSYVTIGTLKQSMLKDTDYIARLYGNVGGETPDVPACEHVYDDDYDADCNKCGETREVPEKPEDPDVPVNEWGVITNPVEGVAYKLGLDQTQKGAIYYFTGVMSGYYGATDTSVDNAIDMYVEIVDGGYMLYFEDANATRKYIALTQSGTHYNFTFGATGSVFTLDAERNAFYATAGDQVCYMGTYGSYVTIGTLTTAKLKDTDYIAHLYGNVGGETPDVPVCEHTYANACDDDCDKCGEVREVPDHVYDDEYDADCNECGATREVPEKPVDPVVGGGFADFNTIVTPKPNGDAGYTGTYTTTNGWTTVNSAIQAGGASVSNPQFPVIGADNTYKAVCLNGKVSAVGKLTSPTLTGGISKLTVDYTKMFTDTVLSVTVTITDLTTGTVYTHTIAKEAAKDDKYTVWTDEWVLETPITGDFTIEFVNDCPSASTSNKDRMTILSVEWEGAASTPDVPGCKHEYDNACDVDCNLCGEAREVTHTVKHVAAKAATCIENGNVEYWYCETCGMAWLDAEGIRNTNLKAVVLPATGEHTYSYPCDPDCDVCGETRELVAGGGTESFNMPDYVVSGELGGGAASRELNDKVTFSISSGWFTTQARIYKNGNGIIASTTPISSITINASSNKDANTFTVNVSEDGTTWTAYQTPAYEKAYTDVTIDFATPVNYIQFVANNAQIRITTMSITFAGGSVHDIQHVAAKDATCAENGNIEYWYCAACGQAWLDAEGIRNTNLKAVVLPATGEHTYDDEYDADCNVCGETREVPEKPVYGGTIAAGTTSGAVGENVNVEIKLEGNPGIVSVKVKLHFDNTVLKLVSYAAGDFSAGGYSWGDIDAANEVGYFIINWCDATNPDSAEDLLATLTFQILEGAKEGAYEIVPEFSCADDIFNFADQTVIFEAVNGSVTVVNTVSGDANGDGNVNNRDLGLLQQYLNAWEVTVDTAAADLTGDGKVNNRDLGMLQQLLNN